MAETTSRHNEAQSLVRRVQESRIEWPRESYSHFIPIDKIKIFEDEATVLKVLEFIFPETNSRDLTRYANAIASGLARIFTILLYYPTEDNRSAILSLVDERVSDEDLPFARVYPIPGTAYLLAGSRHNDREIETFKRWRSMEIMDLDRVQWIAQAPVFKKSEGKIPAHLELNRNTVLPYQEDGEFDVDLVKTGGYSDVWPVRIHPAHQQLFPHLDFSKSSKVGPFPFISGTSVGLISSRAH